MAESGLAPYRDPAVALDARVADLLDRMTRREKAGQLVGTWAGEFKRSNDLDDVRDRITTDHIGSVAAFGWRGGLHADVADIVPVVNELQHVATEETRLGIPLLTPLDAVHGHAYVTEGTVFPNGLGAAATWNPDGVETAAEITAREMRATGATQNYAPTCDVARDPRWGRVYETFGESPHLCGELAAAQVRGLSAGGDADDERVLATAKHFPAYSEPERGEDGGFVDVSSHSLHHVFLPPFERAIEAGVDAVMPCYNAVDGEPAHGSEFLLTDLLRDRLGFEGLVVADWGGVEMLDADHRVEADRQGAVERAYDAGLDISSTGDREHAALLADLVAEGRLSEEWLDERVGVVLAAKFDLGLFEDPYVDLETATAVVGRSDHRAHARRCARESITLLENDGVLPLDGDEDVLVAGPNADNIVHQLGGWSVHEPEGVDGTTLLDGVSDATSGDVTHVQGTTIREALDVEAAATAAADVDVAVVALGEDWYIHEYGLTATEDKPTGAFPTRNDLSLPDPQRELVSAIQATGTPVVGVLIGGRPLAIPDLADSLHALLMAYYPGSEGGRAIADVVFGDHDPTGRLPISFPRDTGDLPVRFNYYSHPTPLGAHEHPPSYDPLYEFGYGLSYTDFAYRDEQATLRPGGETIEVAVTVENTGEREGTEVVQVYVTGRITDTVLPARELVAFDRLTLDPGEDAVVELAIPLDRLAPGRHRVGDAERGDTPPIRGPVTRDVCDTSVQVELADPDD